MRGKQFTFPIKSSERTDTEIDLLSQSLGELITKYQKVKNDKKTVEIRKIQEDISDLRKMMKMVIDEL